MKTIRIVPGASLEEAADQLIQCAPACCQFSGVPLEAFTNDRVSDIVADWLRKVEERRVLFLAGKRDWI